MAEWQYIAIWALGALLWAFLAAVWIRDSGDAVKCAASGAFWPLWLAGAAVALAQAAALASFLGVYFAGKRLREWAHK